MAWSKERDWAQRDLKYCLRFLSSWEGPQLKGLCKKASLGNGSGLSTLVAEKQGYALRKGGRRELLPLRGVHKIDLLAFAFGILSLPYLGYCLDPPSLNKPEPLVWGMLESKAKIIGLEAHGGWHHVWATWCVMRRASIAPTLQGIVNVVVWLFVAQLADILLLCLGRVVIHLRGFKYRILSTGSYGSSLAERGGLPGGEEEVSEGMIRGATAAGWRTGGDALSHDTKEELPKVLVQIPMCNERECYQQAMAAACGLDWPGDRVLIQVLDDSDDAEIRRLINEEVCLWQARGFPIVYLHRLKRTGHKAGNLRYGMEVANGQEFDFVAIFDADFMPTADFLRRTVPHFRGRPDLALVQARWTFVNESQNTLTRLQDIAERYHFEIEQQVMSYMTSFFGFNGTAGVWRLSALEEGGGWEHRTTVEDMDMAVRAHLHGWRFIFLNRVETLCELPSTYASYCKQQHRWFAGPMQLFRLTFKQTLMARNVPLWKKANLLVSFFWLRKLLLPVLTFLLFFVLIPASVLVPEVQIPTWASWGVPLAISAVHCAAATLGLAWLLAVPNLLFENVMALTKFGAIVAGLLGTKSMGEWVVTQKSGSPPTLVRALTPKRDRNADPLHHAEGPAAVQNSSAPVAFPKTGMQNGEQTESRSLAGGFSAPLAIKNHDGRQQLPLNGNHNNNNSNKAAAGLKGNAIETDEKAPKLVAPAKGRGSQHAKVHQRELVWGTALVGFAMCSLLFSDGRHFCLLGLQGIMLLATGANLLER